MNILSFDEYFNNNKHKFVKIDITESEQQKIKEIINIVVPAKATEYHHKIDGNQEYKRFSTGYYGEMAVEKLTGLNFIRYSNKHSNLYNNPDIDNLKIGVKCVEYGKFPIIFKNNYNHEIICVKTDDSTVYVCGLATKTVLNEYQSDSLILSPLLRARGTKTGFYGFDYLIPFKNLDELKKILKEV